MTDAPAAAVRAIVAGEDALARAGLAALLARRPEVALGGEARAAEAVALAAGADAVLLDFASGDGASLRELAAIAPVVALAPDEASAAEAQRAGARAVLFRDAPAERIGAALVAAAAGLAALDPGLGAWIHPPAPAAAAGEELTAREAEVLGLLAEGLSNKGIAARLGVAERTAKFHVESILGKLGAASRSEAIVLAARRGLVVL